MIQHRPANFWDEAVQVGVIEEGEQWLAMGLLKKPHGRK